MKKFILRVWECSFENWQSSMYEFDELDECYRMIDHIHKYGRDVKRHFEIYEVER